MTEPIGSTLSAELSVAPYGDALIPFIDPVGWNIFC